MSRSSGPARRGIRIFMPATSRFRRVLPNLALALALFAGPVQAQHDTAPDTTALSFRGIRAGESLDTLAGAVTRFGGASLGCTISSTDSAVRECRSAWFDPGIGRRVELWLSAIDSLTGIITLKTEGDSADLRVWRSDLEARYGKVPTQLQGSQRMMQWVRRRRMIRLTWRPEGTITTMSVSLVDGRVLDEWGRRKKALNGEP
jgi:hypothetical protein